MPTYSDHIVLAIVYFVSLVVSILLFSYFYALSVQPKTREEKKLNRGDFQKLEKDVWHQCYQFRIVAMVFETLCSINIVLWWFFPIDRWDCAVTRSAWISQVIGGGIIATGFTIMSIGIRDAGEKTAKPSPDTEMYGGIYKYIRHPQSLG